VWVLSEWSKGRFETRLLPAIDCQAGWGENQDFSMMPHLPEVNVDLLVRQPMFRPFYLSTIMSAEGSPVCADSEVFQKLLAEAIPARTAAAGRNRLIGFGLSEVDLMSMRSPASWPVADGRWRHGDFVHVAYVFNRLLYESMVSKGALR
jgi:hypothetical protein